MTTAAKLFTIWLTENERAMLEAHRIERGCRSASEVVRQWINAPTLGKPTVITVKSSIDHLIATGVVHKGIQPVSALGEAIERPKPGSRLKVKK